MKLLVEYGLAGAVLMSVIVAYCLWRSGAPLYVSFGIFAAWLLPAEALLNSTLVLMMLFALPHWHPGRPSRGQRVPSASPAGAPVVRSGSTRKQIRARAET